MDGKVIVVTGALGALGRVVVDEALARRRQDRQRRPCADASAGHG